MDSVCFLQFILMDHLSLMVPAPFDLAMKRIWNQILKNDPDIISKTRLYISATLFAEVFRSFSPSLRPALSDASDGANLEGSSHSHRELLSICLDFFERIACETDPCCNVPRIELIHKATSYMEEQIELLRFYHAAIAQLRLESCQPTS